MAVCRFFQQGNCKYGARCRNEHPRDLKTSNNNSFGSITKAGNTHNIFGGASNPPSEQANVPDITADLIRADLSTEKPQWPFSSYCPVKYGTANLVQDQDLSFEEVRASAYEALKNNTMPAYEQQLNQKATQLNANIQAILGNLAHAVQVSQDKNRSSTGNASANFAQNKPLATQSAFGSTNRPTANPFQLSGNPGAASTFGQAQQNQPISGQTTTPTQASIFNQSATLSKTPFGQSNPPNSVFGQSSSPASIFGKSSTPTSVFGQASQSSSNFGQVGSPASVFGQSSGLALGNGLTSAFGQTSQPQSAFAQTIQPQSVFGQASQQQSSFGQPGSSQSAFGQSSQPASVFGQSSQPTSAFGQTSQPASAFGSVNSPSTLGNTSNGTNNIFGSSSNSGSAFGQTQQPKSLISTGGLANSSAGGTSTPTTNSIFGSQSTPSNPFANSASAFGQSVSTQSAFGQPSQPQSAFASSTQAQVGLGQTPAQAKVAENPQPASSAFGNTSGSTPFGAQSKGIPAVGNVQAQPSPFQANVVGPQSTKNAFGVSAFGGVNTTTGTAQGLANTVPEPESNVSELPEEILAQFRAEQFTIGMIPEIPPPRTLVA